MKNVEPEKLGAWKTREAAGCRKKIRRPANYKNLLRRDFEQAKIVIIEKNY